MHSCPSFMGYFSFSFLTRRVIDTPSGPFEMLSVRSGYSNFDESPLTYCGRSSPLTMAVSIVTSCLLCLRTVCDLFTQATRVTLRSKNWADQSHRYLEPAQIHNRCEKASEKYKASCTTASPTLIISTSTFSTTA